MAIAFILIGIVFLFFVPWVGIVVGIVGLLLALLWIAGFGRRPAPHYGYVDRHRV